MCFRLKVLLRIHDISTTLYKIIQMQSTPNYHCWRLHIHSLPLHSSCWRGWARSRPLLGPWLLQSFGLFGERQIKQPQKEWRTHCYWWERVNLLIKIMDPIISLLRFADTDQRILGEVYEGWYSMIESVRSIIYKVSAPSMRHHQRPSSPQYMIFLSADGTRIAHLCIVCLTHWTQITTKMSGWMVDLLADSLLTWMVKFHKGGRMHWGRFFRIEHPLERWGIPLQSFPLALVNLQDMMWLETGG